MFKDRWLEWVTKRWELINGKIKSERNFELALKDTLTCLGNDVANAVHSRGRTAAGQPPDYRDAVKEIVDAYLTNESRGWRLCDDYGKAARSALHLTDKRKQEDWSDSVDRWKAMLFRAATAICIAIVILGTGWVANRFGIPLPLLRLT